MKYAGIDGCKAGWVGVFLDDTNRWEIHLFKNIEEFFKTYTNLKCVLIDTPIGLPETGKRFCDTLTRRLLTRKRGSSVFPVPCREAVYANSYEEACILNEQFLEVKISKQAWNICDKIREIDSFLRSNPQYKNIVKEAHPELNFSGWQHGKPMEHNKKTQAGIKERVLLLEENFEYTPLIITYAQQKYKRNQVQLDDIIDALILALSAGKYKNLISLPNHLIQDAHKINMNIWYYPKT